MRIEPVEIYSDASNNAVMRHPGRRFPGFLFQGDTLYTLCLQADEVCSSIGREAAAYDEANDLRARLWEALNHYKSVLEVHKLPLPFPERPVSP